MQWTSVVDETVKERTLKCKEISEMKFEVTEFNLNYNIQCLNVPILQGEITNFFQYNGIKMAIDENQKNFRISQIHLELKQRTIDHTFHLTLLKYIFSFVSIIVTYFYWRQIRTYQPDDLGLIQKWIILLLALLILFNEPFSGIRNIFPFKVYYVMQALTQSTFIAMILFFWLVIVHSISSNEVISIDSRRFYLPKIIISLAIWLILTLSMSYVNLKAVGDPSFNWRDDLGSFYSTIQILSVILFLLYSSYFLIVAYVAFFQLTEMKKSYKFSLFLTFGVIFASIILILCEGYSVSSNDSKQQHIS